MEGQADGLSGKLESLIAKFPPERQDEMRELFLGLLEPFQEMQVRRDALKRMEEKYLLALEKNHNVLSLKPGVIPLPPRFQRRWNIRIPALVESNDPTEVYKLALEIHTRSSRHVFLSWPDLAAGARLNSVSLMELTSSTLFIPNVTKLSLLEQHAIMAVIKNEQQSKPFFIAATMMPYGNLKKSSVLDSAFLNAIAGAYFKLTKPVSQYCRDGMIRYFLESLC